MDEACSSLLAGYRRVNGGTLQGVGISRKTGYEISERYEDAGSKE